MKPSAIRIERMLDKIEATLVSRPRPYLHIIIHEGDDEAAAMEKVLAEHVACHPEDAGRTVKDCRWTIREIVQWPRPNPMSADEISAAEISAAAARNEITKGKAGLKVSPLSGCRGTDAPPETLEPFDLPPPAPACRAMRRASGSASARPRTRPPTMLISSIGRSMPASPIPKSRR